jgi:biopolymer transport protein ExbB
MIRSFSALGETGGAGAAGELAVGISEALYNTAWVSEHLLWL